MKEGNAYISAIFALICVLALGASTIDLMVRSPIKEPKSGFGLWEVTPLLAAVGAEDTEKVRELLEHGANPDDPAAGRSPLMQAVTLLGSKTIYWDCGKTTHLCSAQMMRCNLPIVRLLLAHGANPNRADPGIGSLPLLTAFAIGDLECARVLRQAGAQPKLRDSGGHTILSSAVDAAANSGDMKILDVAIDWGIEKNDSGDDGETALHHAVWDHSVQVVQELLKRGVDPCIKDKIGWTPLAMAISLHRDDAIINALTRATHCIRIS